MARFNINARGERVDTTTGKVVTVAQARAILSSGGGSTSGKTVAKVDYPTLFANPLEPSAHEATELTLAKQRAANEASTSRSAVTTRSSNTTARDVINNSRNLDLTLPVRITTERPMIVSSNVSNTPVADNVYSKYYKSRNNPFLALYDVIDYGVGGWLPSGIPRDVVAAYDAERATNNLILRNQATQSLQQQKVLEDYNTKSWYEYLGFGYSDAEAAYQRQNRANIDTFLTGLPFNQNSSSSDGDSILNGISTGFKWAIPIVLGLIAVGVMKK